MKCSKCGYISFDYNQVCPKCNKEISSDQGKLNLPAFRPDPPTLLGALTGEHNESQVDLSFDSGSGMGARVDADEDLEDSVVMGSAEMSLDEEEGLDISLETEDTGEFEEPAEEEITESVSDFDLAGEDEEISLDMDDLSTEESDSQEIAPIESAVEEEELTIDFDEAPLDDSEDGGEVKIQEASDEGEEIDIDSLALDAEDAGKDEEQDEVELDLDDLEIDDSGQFEVSGAEAPDEALDKGAEIEIDLDAISTEEPEALDVSPEGDEELAVDLEDLDIDLDLEKSDD
jgi:hypothetical protein